VRGPEVLQEAQQELNPQTQPEELASNLTMQGRYQHYRGLHTQAIALFEQAREIAEPAGLLIPLNYIYAFLAGAYQHLAQIDQSLGWAWKCVELGERSAFPLAEAVGYEFLAEDMFFLARWEEGIRYAKKDQEIGERVGSLDRVAWSGFPHSNCLFCQGRLSEALQMAENSLILAEQTGDHRLVVWVKALLGMILSDLGEAETAWQTTKEALELSNQLNQVVLQCWSIHSLVYQTNKKADWDEALRLCRLGIDLYTPVESQIVRAYIAPVYAESLLGAGRVQEAEQFLTSFIAASGKMQTDFFLAVVQRVLGQVLAAQDRWEEAGAAFDTAIERFSTQDSRLELAYAYQERGRMLVRKGEQAAGQKDLVRAQELFRQCGALGRFGKQAAG
jgi:tetratricopeptide (TPR) repeat protein